MQPATCNNEESFHDILKKKMDKYVHLVYEVTNSFPKEELYGVTSQLRRAALSVILNNLEGFARRKGKNCKVYKNFMEISYGSLKESKYLVYFSMTVGYCDKKSYDPLVQLADEIGAMLYRTINN